jgi:hypothetical protein
MSEKLLSDVISTTLDERFKGKGYKLKAGFAGDNVDDFLYYIHEKVLDLEQELEEAQKAYENMQKEVVVNAPF